ncbi:MAG: hypothetical protein R2736_02470 [Solirubrobacterales bacterium]
MAGEAGPARSSPPLASLRDVARERAAVYDELVAPRIGADGAAERSLGERPGAAVDVPTRTVFFCVLHDAVVSSKSNVLVADGVPLLDHQDDRCCAADHVLDVDPIVFAARRRRDGARGGSCARWRAAGTRAPARGGQHLQLRPLAAEFLPKVWWTQSRPGFAEVPIIVDEQMHPQLRPALELFLLGATTRSSCSRGAKRCACASCGGARRRPTSACRERATRPAHARRRCSGRRGAPPEPPAGGGRRRRYKRIFLARQDTQHPPDGQPARGPGVVSRPRLRRVRPGELPFREQPTRAADVVVGPDGSALGWRVPRRAGHPRGLSQQPDPRYHWWIALLSQALGQRMALLTGPVVHEN